MSAEQHKNANKESRAEFAGRLGQALAFVGGVAIALAQWSVKAGIPFFLYAEAGSTVLRWWGAKNRNKPKREGFFKRRTVKMAQAGGGH